MSRPEDEAREDEQALEPTAPELEASTHCPTCGRDWDGKPARPVHLAAVLTYDPTGWDKTQQILEDHRAGIVQVLRDLAEQQSDPALRALAHEAADMFEERFTAPPDLIE